MTPHRLAGLLRPATAGRRAFYRLPTVRATEGSANEANAPAISGSDSGRVADARARAAQRLSRQRGALRPLGWAVIVVVAAGTLGGHPAPGLHGKSLGLTLALCAFVAALALAIRDKFTELTYSVQAAVISAMGGAGVALAALQLRGATGLAAGAAVWMGLARLPWALGVTLGTAVTIALDTAMALAGSSSAAVFAATLLCLLLGAMARFMKQARESQDRTELLLAQLQDAREAQTEAAAVAERGRIASELHDVLAHSLSGAAIQLQGARMLAEREHAQPQTRAAIDRAAELVKDGLANARHAVGALRGDDLPTVMQLASLVESFRNDMNLDVTLRIEGPARPLPAEASLALYRGAQEALTNVGRYAPAASTGVVLRYEGDRTTLSVENHLPGSAPAVGELAHVGGGRGLAGMRERIERAGGHAHAGPTDDGWRVDLDVPA